MQHLGGRGPGGRPVQVGEPPAQGRHEVQHGRGRVAVPGEPVSSAVVEVVVLELLLQGPSVEVQALVPVVSGDDASLPGDALPEREGERRRRAVGIFQRGDRELADGPEHVSAAVAGACGLQQAQYQAGHRTLGDGAHPGAVDLDPGGGEVLVEQARVGVASGIQDRDAVGGSGAQGLHDVPDDAAHLVVGVGGVHDPLHGGRGAERRGWDVGRDGCDRLGDGRVGARVAGVPGDDVGVGEPGEPRGQGGLGVGEVLGQVDHHAAELGCTFGREGGGRRVEQVGLVVVAVGDPFPCCTVDPHDLGAQAAGPGD
ncbi:hypothetical protein [Ornithinimicrobium kibberense]|uniref:hypothetical protein n=1 Tax=Ornithinimicrobium kibberense TaxID=282060 RepID=UPI00361AE097